MILSLIVFVIRVALLAAFTFAFVVLFEHGTTGFVEGASQEWNSFSETIESLSKPAEKPVVPGT